MATITLHLTGISDGHIIFNVADDLAKDVFDLIEAEEEKEEDVQEKSRVKLTIWLLANISFWLPRRVLDYCWTRNYVIILPSWAFNKLILGEIIKT